MRPSRYSSVVSLLIAGARASSSNSLTSVHRRQSIAQDSSNSIPPGCISACDPLFIFQDNCAANVFSIAQCVCVPEFVVHSNACSDCVVRESLATQNETTASVSGETLQVAIDDALQEFLNACKDEVGIDLTITVSNTFTTETSGPAVAAAALPTDGPTSGEPMAVGKISGSAALLMAASTLALLNV
ncbi:hypothetical protein H1R20_g1303, partial [Candolleomyces eurysporus]